MTTLPETEKTPDADGLDPNSMAAIRNLMAAESEVVAQSVKKQKAAKAKAAFVALPDADGPGSGASAAASRSKPPRKNVVKSKTRAQKSNAAPGFLARAKARVFGYRPTAKHIVLLCIALLILFRPLLVLGALFLITFVVIGIFLILGYDGFWLRTMGLARWYARRNPDRAADLHGKLDRFAMKWDAVLDRFPEGSVDGLYLPDFGDQAEAEALHDAALDRRFDSLRKKGV